MRPISILEAPSILGLRPTGLENLPEALQNAGLRECLRARHAGRLESPAYNERRDSETGFLNPQGIADYSRQLASKIGEILDSGDFPLVLGGDCSILLGSMLALHPRGRHGLLFLDGHMDFYQAEASINGEAASSELALVTGRGPALMTTYDGRCPLVADEDVVAFGFRDEDEAQSYGSQPLPPRMKALNLAEVRRLGAEAAVREAVSYLAGKDIRGFWIHFDADVLSDEIMPAVDYRQPDGLSWEEIAAVLRIALRHPLAVGMEITIFNPTLDADGTILRKFVDVLCGPLGTAPRIEKLVYGGDGLARIDGKVVFVPYSLPGEEWAEGKLLSASPDRIEAKCPYFARCGGCHYQHMPYERQLREKKAILEETLARIGKLTPSSIDIASAEPWEYRNRVQLHFERGQLGFHAAGSKKLIAITHCPISSPGINHAIHAIREMRRDPKFPRFLNSMELFTNESQTLVNVLSSDRPLSKRFFEWCAERIPGALASALDYPTANGTYHVSHKSFFQVNRFLIDKLVELALVNAKGSTAIDLYAGVGLFSRPLTAQFDRVTAVEVVRSAAADLAINAPKATVVQKTTEDFLATLDAAPDFILADPPRAGLGKRAVENLVRLKPRQLTIISCDPSTLARDLAALTAGGFEIEAMTLVDLFPQTYHIETVTRLIST